VNLILFSGAWGKMIHEKILKQKFRDTVPLTAAFKVHDYSRLYLRHTVPAKKIYNYIQCTYFSSSHLTVAALSRLQQNTPGSKVPKYLEN
jgi:hypothetical protein